MLKILEEPLAQRLIIATTTSLTTILPTIVSRAQCINCSLASQEDISQYLHQCYHHLADEIHHRIITMCGSAIGIADTLAQQSAEEINHYYQHCEIVLQ